MALRFSPSTPTKTAAEVEKLRVAGHLVSKALAEVAAHVKPGVTTQALDDIAAQVLTAAGGRPAFQGYDPGWGGGPFPGVCCISVNDEVVHGIPGGYELVEGDLVTVDTGVELDGFFGDSAYTFAVGRVSDEAKRLMRVTYEALYKGVEQAVHGRRVGDIGHAVQSHCEAEGFGVVRQLVGHSIGRTLHEGLSIPNYGRRGVGAKLKAGMTLCIEPMITAGTHVVDTAADGWTVVTADERPAAHYEHMVAIRDSGAPDLLTTFEPIERVLGGAPFA